VDNTGAEESNSSRVVAANTVWGALEIVFGVAGMLVTTVGVARIIGPERLGYFSFIYWLTSMTTQVGSMGLPLATFKFTGEFLGSGDLGQARAVISRSLGLQAISAGVLVAAGAGLLLVAGDRAQLTMSLLLVSSMIPQMLAFVPSRANAACEDIGANTRADIAGVIVNVVLIWASLLLGWDLIGIAAAVLTSRSVETVLKLRSARRHYGVWPKARLRQETAHRLFAFSGKSTVLMLLNMMVWDRSDLVLLKFLNSDVRQITFFSSAFMVSDRLLAIPQALTGALSAKLIGEYGRNRERMIRLTGAAGRYTLLAALPMLAGAAALSSPMVRIVYGPQYVPAIAVFALVAAFAIPKSLCPPAQNLLYSTEELGFLLGITCASAVVDAAIDFALIPRFGAGGAAIGNGMAQALAAVLIWNRVFRRYPIEPDVKSILKIVAAAAGMLALVVPVSRSGLPAALQALVGVSVGAVAYCTLLRLFRALNAEDRGRLLGALTLLPRGRKPVLWLVNWTIPPQPAEIAAAAAGDSQGR
jgi:O-antigen/teichoic acid export membrane protein